ncbi:DUF4062 domain-containing protein [Raoultella planticola]|uniref:DUF4062 domain-containing protein n=1 Tax=Raoultella planticola TaxID=575 RepID=UPI0021134F22|nr:DUF4062 domain-containing protein [Raoultella planticola]MCQ6500171.1 DUF4062 domain-containing protein [Raoultella planticola]
MDDKKYQVFVSSTYIDLIDARKKIIETVLSLYHFPVGMEMFSADDSEQWEIIRETIDASDYYVIIIGHKYGSTSVNGISYTEMEYDYAKSLNIPVLAFIRNRDVFTKQNEREDDLSKAKELDRFIEKAKANKMCDFWESIEDLATKVAIALPKVMRRTPRIGWVRGDQATPKEVSNELAELSTENRQLRERLREYESQLLAESPSLRITTLPENKVFNFSYLPNPQEYVKPFTRKDTPENYLHVISDEDIENYNAKIPSDDMVDEYNKKMFLKYCYENHSISFTPLLENFGKKVATDIYIDIVLPDFIIAVSGDDEDSFQSKIPKINIPETPLEQVRKKEIKYHGAMSIGLGIFDRGGIQPPELNIISRHINKIQSVNASDWVSCKGNKILLRAKKLIQSRSITFDKIILVPISPGEGEIEFKILCEEMKEPHVFNQRVSVKI